MALRSYWDRGAFACKFPIEANGKLARPAGQRWALKLLRDFGRPACSSERNLMRTIPRRSVFFWTGLIALIKCQQSTLISVAQNFVKAAQKLPFVEGSSNDSTRLSRDLAPLKISISSC